MATAGTICLLSVGVAASAAGQSPAREGSGASAGAAPSRPGRVAVIPFANLSGDPADAWIGAGLAETVATDLEQLASLTIVTRAALAAGPLAGAGNGDPGNGDPDDAAALAAAGGLGAAWLVTGSFERRGPQLQVTARIVRVTTGAVRRTVRVDG